MPRHSETRQVPYRADQLFDLVADVARYPEFLPWCVGARVRTRTETEMVADLTIGFGPFRESFTSRVALHRPDQPESEHRIGVRYENGPFRYLTNQWRFEPTGSGSRVHFHVDFEFRSKLLQMAIGAVFHEAVRRMVAAFLARARTVYGPPPPPEHGLVPRPASEGGAGT
jgi:coenzyme Q-binding protein COQ10